MKAVQASPNQVSYNMYVCGSCNKTAEKLQKCAGCHFILYCDRNCQKKDWPKHKNVCQQKKHLEVAQESAAILVNKTTPQTLQYLFTKRIMIKQLFFCKFDHFLLFSLLFIRFLSTHFLDSSCLNIAFRLPILRGSQGLLRLPNVELTLCLGTTRLLLSAA